jgi:FkbM family methyltransferase
VKQVVQKAANSLGYRVSKIRQPIEYPYIDVLDLVLKDYMRQEPDIFFIQIGANDGVSADPVTQLIKKYHLRGLLVEPQPKMFKKLVENYQDEAQLIFENSVVSQEDGTATLYAISEEEAGLPMWCYQIASLDRDKMLTMLSDVKDKLNLPKNIETLIKAIPLPALTFKTLLSKHGIKKLDLLIIDTIGYDFEILKMVPFDSIKPQIINFEHTLLSLDDQEACFKYLAGHGYSFAQVGVDTVAYLQAPSKQGLYSL